MPESRDKLPTYARCLVYHKHGKGMAVLLVEPAHSKRWQILGRANSTAHPHKMRMKVRDSRFFPLKEAAAHLDKRQQQLLASLMSMLAFSEIA